MPASLRRAMDGIDIAYYLVHSIGQGAFEGRDRSGAAHFAAAARRAGVRRIVYLGGPAPSGASSAHLRSRAEVGRILAGSAVSTIS